MQKTSDVTAESSSPAGRQIRRKYWVGAALIATVALLLHLYSAGWSTQRLTLRDGRSYDVLNWDRHISYSVAPDGRRSAEQYFWVRYYSRFRQPAQMLQEARGLLLVVSPVAESAGYAMVKIEPSYPSLSERFPVAVHSWSVTFARDSVGLWREVR
jgi:hypothetical protein